jgi:hypothetical protein
MHSVPQIMSRLPQAHEKRAAARAVLIVSKLARLNHGGHFVSNPAIPGIGKINTAS